VAERRDRLQLLTATRCMGETAYRLRRRSARRTAPVDRVSRCDYLCCRGSISGANAMKSSAK
jgi:hypothetical protein